MDRNEAIAKIREALKTRSGKAWTVKGGRGTSWGWIEIDTVPRRKVDGFISDEERAELARLLGVDVGTQGVSIPASGDYRREYVDRAEGRVPSVIGRPYWD